VAAAAVAQLDRNPRGALATALRAERVETPEALSALTTAERDPARAAKCDRERAVRRPRPHPRAQL
jgi:hypothetical protein